MATRIAATVDVSPPAADGQRYALVDGRTVETSPSNALHETFVPGLSHGTLAVLGIDPSHRSGVRWRADGARQCTGAEEVDFDPAPPGFRGTASDLFVPSREDETGTPTNVE